MSATCGCCEGTGSVAPEPTSNRPGLDALRYRVGTHASFLDRMTAALTLANDPALDALTTRAPDDPTLALLDAWATVADVLTFYQERIANEGYLRTATERRSILELGRLVGYELRPGVAASVYLAYTLEKGYDTEIPAGSRAQSLPGGAGELPQSFETSTPLEAREGWNYLEPRKSRPTVIVPRGATVTRILSASSVEIVYLAGTSANLKANDRVLLMFNPARPHARIVLSAETEPAAQRTKVVLLPEAPDDLLKKKGKERAQPVNLNAVVESLKEGPAPRQLSSAHLNRQVKDTFAPTADVAANLLAVSNPLLRETFYRAWANANITPASSLTSVDALRIKAPLFGHNALPKPILNSQGVSEGTEEWPLGDPLVIRIRIGVGRREDGGEEGGEEADPPVFANNIRGLGVMEVAIRRGAESGTESIVLGTGRLSGRIDGIAIAIVPPTARQGATEIVLTPDEGNRFGLAATQRIVVAAATGGVVETVPVLKIVVHDGDDKDPEQTVRPGEPVRYQAGERRVTIEQSPQLFAFTEEWRTGISRAERERAETIVTLDATYDQIVPGSWIVIERLNADGTKLPPFVSRVTDVATLTKTAYNITAKVTQLTIEKPTASDRSWLDPQWLEGHRHSLSALRHTTVYAQNDPQQLTEEPVVGDVEREQIELQGLYDGLASGRWLIVTGERTDIPGTEGVPGTELVMLARIEQDVERVTIDNEVRAVEGSRTRSTLFLANALAYTYKRDTVRIYGNVVKATHGETRTELLGSGDGSKPFQQFTLKQPPLTFVAATNPSGVETTLDVRVNEVSWHPVPALVDAGADDRCYTTQTDDAGHVTVVFGDGVHGARLPTGLQNVTSVYRNGIGRVGNAKKDQVTLLMTRPLGVKEVINPIAASGGADPESRDDARGNVPLSLLALDRLVSVPDYEAFTRTFAGIGKAQATRLSDGRHALVHITIAGADDIPVDQTSDLYRHLNLALREFGDPQQRIHVASREMLFLIMSATVALQPDYHWQDVERRLRAALLEAFSFKVRQLGQDVVLSEVLSVMHGVEGVQYVDVDVLDRVSELTPPDELKTLGNALTLKPRVAVELARPHAGGPTPAQIAIFTPDVPDTLILRGPQK